MTETYKDWSNKLPYALWAYRTSIRSSTGVTPYSLVYGIEAVLPVELRIPSLRVMIEASLPESEWAKARHQELQMIDEKRLRALYHIQGYQRRIERAFNKKVRVRDLKSGDLVLKSYRAPCPICPDFIEVCEDDALGWITYRLEAIQPSQ
ncbi:uncharacterized protein LOC143880569 [Tasmannia lanceolata]|uniref:uncharacterized protein LOC143880569 n=1 Tax=Tasmannia lanceolata TaxID=3420 RepID=UPI004062D86A